LISGIANVGNLAAFLVSDGASAVTGNVEYIDACYQVVD
jgi:enoyl-[acyl-carrier protein] reductase I